MAHYGLGLSLKAMKKVNEAILEFRKANESSSKFIDSYLEAGTSLVTVGKPEEAKLEFEKAAQIYRDLFKKGAESSVARLRFAEVLIQLGKHKEAKENLQKVLKAEKPQSALYAQAQSLIGRIK